MSWFGYLQPKSLGVIAKTAQDGGDHAISPSDWEVLGESVKRSHGGKSTPGEHEEEEDVFVSDDETSSSLIIESGGNLNDQIDLLTKQLSVSQREKTTVEEEVISMEAKIRALERSRQADGHLRSELEEMRQKVERSKMEADSTSEEVERMKKEIASLRDELHQVEVRARLEAEALRTTLEGQSRMAVDAEREGSELRERLKDAKDESDRLSAQAEKLKKTLATEKERGDFLQEQLNGLEKVNKLLKSEAKDISDQNSRILGMLSNRLCGWEGTPATSDPVDETAVVQKLRRLNEEIFETAAYISESFAFDGGVRKLDDLKEACTRARKALGSVVLHKLVSIRHDEDPLLVQIACQAGMVECCRKIISSWGCDVPKADQSLPELFSRLKKSGM